MRYALLVLGIVLVNGCASQRQVASPDSQVREIEARRQQLEYQQRVLQAALEREKPITIDFVRKDPLVVRHLLGRDEYQVGNIHVVMHFGPRGSGDWSYNPELHSMGLRIGSDGQPKRIASDGEVPATWEDLRRAQGFGR